MYDLDVAAEGFSPDRASRASNTFVGKESELPRSSNPTSLPISRPSATTQED